MRFLELNKKHMYLGFSILLGLYVCMQSAATALAPKLILDSLYTFDTYETFLKNARGLQSRLSAEEYEKLSPDNMNNLVTYRRLTSVPMTYTVYKRAYNPLSGEVTVFFHINATGVSAERSFVICTKVNPLLKIVEVNRWELLSL